MHKIIVPAPQLMLGSGEVIGLSAAQLASRRHNVEVIEQAKNGSATVRIINPLTFKANEELLVEKMPKSLGTSVAVVEDVKPTKAPSKNALAKAYDEGFAEGRVDGLKALAEELNKGRKLARAELLAEIEKRNGLIDTLEAAQAAIEGLGSDATDEQRSAAQQAADDAQAAVDALQKLEA